MTISKEEKRARAKAAEAKYNSERTAALAEVELASRRYKARMTLAGEILMDTLREIEDAKGAS